MYFIKHLLYYEGARLQTRSYTTASPTILSLNQKQGTFHEGHNIELSYNKWPVRNYMNSMV